MEKEVEHIEEGFYCTTCGNSLSKKATICPHCGVPVKGGEIDKPTITKDKTVAVLLAIFLSFWTWVYTYDKDAWKFWLNLALSIVTLGIWGASVSWIWAIIDVAVKPPSYYLNYPNE
ncbi:MAG: zinc-ribbon domain-containing protein [Candidatus Humimicrobiaceae bacterium]